MIWLDPAGALWSCLLDIKVPWFMPQLMVARRTVLVAVFVKICCTLLKLALRARSRRLLGRLILKRSEVNQS